MADTKLLRVILRPDEFEAVERVAAQRGYDSTSAYVRAALGLRVPGLAGITPMRESVSTVETLPTCSKASLHVSGKRCGYCKQVPS